ncbi:MAG TPA: ATP-binding protein, partial [Roseimicrobium sp.]|nr:ATP-binding protein [Roseimicrobium sp.]
GQGGDMLRQMLSGAFPVPPDVQRLFDEAGSGHYYYVVWSAEHEEVKRSTNAPAIIPMPENSAALTNGVTRTREDVREFIQSGRRGTVILVGSHIASDRAELNRLAGLLALAGVGVLALGLAGGWWLSSRAIRPIEDISATAVKIAGGDLSERIRIKDAASELEALAGVLNNTFERLDTAFARQVQFTADASHELRTPISVVLSQTQTALKRERSAEEYRETINACQRSAQRMGQLVESLLELARLDAGQEPLKREACDIAKVARECIELLQPIIQDRKITVVQQLQPALCSADTQRLAQVITNLVSNAVHYNRVSGSITVKTWSEAGSVCLSVADTGIGIPKDELPHVFERFFRVDKSRSNAGGRTGLGLAICKSIADAHGGKIEAISEMGAGTTFTLALPAGNPQPVS